LRLDLEKVAASMKTKRAMENCRPSVVVRGRDVPLRCESVPVLLRHRRLHCGYLR